MVCHDLIHLSEQTVFLSIEKGGINKIPRKPATRMKTGQKNPVPFRNRYCILPARFRIFVSYTGMDGKRKIKNGNRTGTS